MPELNLTTVITSIIVVLLLALPFVAARLPHSRRTVSGNLESCSPATRDLERSGPGPGFTYALVPPGGHPEDEDGGEKGSWQWCLAFIPEETSEGGSELPPWWAPAPPWSAAAEHDGDFTRDADVLQAVFDETSAYPAARSSGV